MCWAAIVDKTVAKIGPTHGVHEKLKVNPKR